MEYFKYWLRRQGADLLPETIQAETKASAEEDRVSQQGQRRHNCQMIYE